MSNRFFVRTALSTCVCLLSIFTLSLSLFSAPPAKKQKSSSAPKTAPATYKGAIVINAEDGAILFEDNPDVVNPPASVTKLMTFLIVHDAIAAGQIALDTPVPVTVEDSKIGGTQVWLDPKETFPVEELLYALMIQSANDCANALSRAAAGSRPAFVERMNARAKDLGMTNTTFVTPHGLPPANRKIADGDLTTPRDLATLSRYLVTKTDVLKYSSVRTRPFGEAQRPANTRIAMTNHNHLLGKVPGVDGLKTGFTNGAGFCLAATAERNGNRIIVVTMGSPDRISRDAKIAELIENAFAKLPPKPPAPKSPISPVSPVAPSATTPVSGIATPIVTPTTTTPAPAVTPAPGATTSDLPQITFPTPVSTPPRKK